MFFVLLCVCFLNALFVFFCVLFVLVLVVSLLGNFLLQQGKPKGNPAFGGVPYLLRADV